MVAVVHKHLSSPLDTCLALIANSETRIDGLRQINLFNHDIDVLRLVTRYFLDNDPFVLAAAALAAGKTGKPQAGRPLIALLQRHHNEIVILNILYALQKLKYHPAQSAVLPLLKHGNAFLVHTAVVTLGVLGDRQVIASLEEKKSHSNREVRAAAGVAIEEINRRIVSKKRSVKRLPLPAKREPEVQPSP